MFLLHISSVLLLMKCFCYYMYLFNTYMGLTERKFEPNFFGVYILIATLNQHKQIKSNFCLF